MRRAWRSRVEEPNNSIYSAASLALRVIFSVSCCGTYSVLSRSPSIIHADDIIHDEDVVRWRTHSNHLVMKYVCMWLCMLAWYNETPDRNDLKLGTVVVPTRHHIEAYWFWVQKVKGQGYNVVCRWGILSPRSGHSCLLQFRIRIQVYRAATHNRHMPCTHARAHTHHFNSRYSGTFG